MSTGPLENSTVAREQCWVVISDNHVDTFHPEMWGPGFGGGGQDPGAKGAVPGGALRIVGCSFLLEIKGVLTLTLVPYSDSCVQGCINQNSIVG